MARKLTRIQKREIAVLTKARNLIRDVGWCQNQYEKMDEKGKVVAYCARGALEVAAAGTGLWDIYRKVNNVLPPRYDSMISYNDNRNRKKREIINLFNKAIKLVKEEKS